MDASERDDWRTGIDRLNQIDCKGSTEIRLASPDRLPDGNAWHLLIADIGKTFRAQKLLADVLRSKADSPSLCNSHGGGLKCSFGGQQRRRAEASGAGQ